MRPLEPTYIKLRKDAKADLTGSAAKLIEALRKLDGKATYGQLARATKLSRSALHTLIARLKEMQVIEVVNPSLKKSA
ncbi:MAG: winged helix-turn-helix transcriptional regulator [Cyanobacteria bacterium P01_G01_bin.38]